MALATCFDNISENLFAGKKLSVYFLENTNVVRQIELFLAFPTQHQPIMHVSLLS